MPVVAYQGAKVATDTVALTFACGRSIRTLLGSEPAGKYTIGWIEADSFENGSEKSTS